ncbi:MAG: alpha/beta hydrolase [Pirellulaceae bacterium]
MIHRSPIVRSLVVLALLLASLAGAAVARGEEKNQGETVTLWPEGKVPGLAAGEAEEIVENTDQRIGRRVTKVTKPQITVYRPPAEKANGSAVVICPGGGYHILAYDLEGVEVAKWLNGLGVTGIVLHYRVPRAKEGPAHQWPLADAQRAIRLARASAEKWSLDPEKIGVMGFSAGGHLAAVASVGREEEAYPAVDAIDQENPRPNFSLLVYPAYLNPQESDVELAPEFQIDDQAPPTLLIHTGDDNVSSTGSIAYYLAMKRQNRPAELHIFPSGGHGYGLRPTEKRVTAWPELAEGFLREIKAIPGG